LRTDPPQRNIDDASRAAFSMRNEELPTSYHAAINAHIGNAQGWPHDMQRV
jgi:hypothetical protein